MGRFDRAVGLVRSLAIYNAIPLRQRRMRRLYSRFVKPGDLVFDIGAHTGNRARAFHALGCRVVALEPQPDFARLLRLLFARARGIEIIEAAVSEVPEPRQLLISERTPTVTTIAEEWRRERAGEPDFDGVRWNAHIEVATTTLDRLIAQFGAPAFVKIDVEGSEPKVLAGLTQAVTALSFEYLPRALPHVRACVDRLTALGNYRFNWSTGESYRLAQQSWVNELELLAHLGSAAASRQSGDVYAQLVE